MISPPPRPGARIPRRIAPLALTALVALLATPAQGQQVVIVRDKTTTNTVRVYAPGDAVGTIGGSIIFGSDGTNARAVKTDNTGTLVVTGGGSGSLSVTLATRVAGENIAGTRGAISDWLEIYKAGTYVSTPTKTTTVVGANAAACVTIGGASCTIIYASTDWQAWPNYCITLRETAGANPITNVEVEYSPDNTNWERWDSTTFAALGASTMKSLCLSGQARRYLRIEAQSAAGSTVDAWITANQN